LVEQDKENLCTSEAVAQFLERVWPRSDHLACYTSERAFKGLTIKFHLQFTLVGTELLWLAMRKAVKLLAAPLFDTFFVYAYSCSIGSLQNQ